MTEELPIVKSVKAIIEGDDNFWAMMKAQPLLDRLEWAAFKMCKRGHHEDFASDVMTEAADRIEYLEEALKKIGIMIWEDNKEGALYVVRAALAEEKKDE